MNIRKRRIVLGRRPYRGPNYPLRIAVAAALLALGLLWGFLYLIGAVR